MTKEEPTSAKPPAESEPILTEEEPASTKSPPKAVRFAAEDEQTELEPEAVTSEAEVGEVDEEQSPIDAVSGVDEQTEASVAVAQDATAEELITHVATADEAAEEASATARVPPPPPPALFIPKYAVGDEVEVYFPPGPLGKWTQGAVTKVNVKGCAYTVTYSGGSKDWGIKEESMRRLIHYEVEDSNVTVSSDEEEVLKAANLPDESFLTSPLFDMSRPVRPDVQEHLNATSRAQLLIALRSEVDHLRARRDERRADIAEQRERYQTNVTLDALVSLRKTASLTRKWVTDPNLSDKERVRASIMAHATTRRQNTMVPKLSEWKNTAVSLTSPSKNDGQAQEKLTLRVDELLSRETSQNLQLRKWRDMETQLQVQRLGILRSIRRLKHMLKETRVLQGGAVATRKSWMGRFKSASKEGHTLVLVANANRVMIEGTWAQRATDVRRDYAEAMRTVHADLASESEVIRLPDHLTKLGFTNDCACRDKIASIAKTHKIVFTQQRKAIDLKASALRLSNVGQKKRAATTASAMAESGAKVPQKRKNTIKFDLNSLQEKWKAQNVPFDHRISILFDFLTCEDDTEIATDVLAYLKNEESRLRAMHKIHSTPTSLEPIVDPEIVGVTSAAITRIAKLQDMRQQARLGLSRQAFEAAISAQEKIRREGRESR